MWSSKKQKQKLTDTPLHVILRTAKTIAQIKEFFASQSKDDLADMATTVNDKGELPFFMISALPFSHKEHKELQELLIPHSIPKSYIPLSHSIDEKQILSRYSHLKDTPTYENLKLAASAIQKARQSFKESSTHAEANDLSEEKRQEVFDTIIKKRAEYKIEAEIEDKKNSSLPFKEKILKKIQHHFKYYSGGVANCEELGYATIHFIHEMNSKKNAGMWLIESDDHLVVIIEADTPNAVFCDALAGDVFPASEVPTRLHSFYRIKNESSYYNCFAKFNPEFHYLAEYMTLADQKITPDKCIIPYISPFRNSKDATLLKKQINKPYMNGYTPLYFLVKENDFAQAKTIIGMKADPNLGGKLGVKPLVKAAELGNYEMTKLLLDSNADINRSDESGETALIYAVNGGHEKIAKYLLQKKADPNRARHDGATPLFFMKQKTCASIVKMLIEHKGDINFKIKNDTTPLIDSVYTRDFLLFKTILEAKANPNLASKDGLTALYLAAEYGLVDHIKLLLENKADPKIVYKGEFIAMDVAVQAHQEEVIKILKEYDKTLTRKIA